MKTKNAPKDLKCKINDTFFFGNRGSQKGGRGGVRHLGKIPKKYRFFGGVASLRSCVSPGTSAYGFQFYQGFFIRLSAGRILFYWLLILPRICFLQIFCRSQFVLFSVDMSNIGATLWPDGADKAITTSDNSVASFLALRSFDNKILKENLFKKDADSTQKAI